MSNGLFGAKKKAFRFGVDPAIPEVPAPAPVLPVAGPDLAGTVEEGPSGKPVVSARQEVPEIPYTPPPTIKEIPSDVPKGFKGVFKRALLGMIPGYTQGYEYARQQAQQTAQEDYERRFGEWQQEQTRVYRNAQLKHDYEKLQNDAEKAMMAHQIRTEANRIKEQADQRRLTEQLNFHTGLVDKLYPHLNEPGKELERSNFIASGIDKDLLWLYEQTKPGVWEQKLNAFQKALKEAEERMVRGEPGPTPQEVKTFFGVRPPAGAQPRTTYGWIGYDIQGKPVWGIKSQTMPGLGAQPGAPTPAVPGQQQPTVTPSLATDIDAIVNEQATAQGIDADLIRAMIQQESAGDPRAVSAKGAGGIMQLMPGTAGDFGLSPEDRFNPQKAIPAGVAYLRQQLDRYGGDLDKALAAYNAGAGVVEQHGGVPPFAETRDYVTKIKADYFRRKEAVGVSAQPPQPTPPVPPTPTPRLGEQVHPSLLKTQERIFQPALEADTRLSIMQKDAADPSGQSDISLLFNHIGMTLGAQKGARITEAEIARAIGARSLPQEILARWDRVSKGSFLSTTQRDEMVKLGQNMRREMWIRSRAQAKQAGIGTEPPQHPDLPYLPPEGGAAPSGGGPAPSGKAYPRQVVQKYADEMKISYDEAKKAFEAKGHKVYD